MPDNKPVGISYTKSNLCSKVNSPKNPSLVSLCYKIRNKKREEIENDREVKLMNTGTSLIHWNS